MRLFVAIWPPPSVLGVLGDAITRRRVPGLRWVDLHNWHVTLDFLGEVPDGELDDLAEAVAAVASSSAPATATIGPTTTVLGRSVLCAPVRGVDGIAGPVRRATRPFNRSPDRDRAFAGHLTVARANGRRPIPPELRGLAVAASWTVDEIAVVSSLTRPEGPLYTTEATARLGG